MADVVHRLKHKMGIVGMDEASKISDAYESNLRNKSLDLKVDFESSLSIINEYIQILK